MKKLILRHLETVCDEVFFKIEEQSHRGYEFGDVNSDKFVARNNIELVSLLFPDTYIDMDNKIVVCCRGRETGEDDRIIISQKDQWERIKVVVKEYNEHFGYFGECILGKIIGDIVPREMFIID